MTAISNTPPAPPAPPAHAAHAAPPTYTIGSRVRITQQIPFHKHPTAATLEGVILRMGQQKTGSWFAHARDNKLWLDRIELRKDDGEIVVVNLDQFTVVEPIGGASTDLRAQNRS